MASSKRSRMERGSSSNISNAAAPPPPAMSPQDQLEFISIDARHLYHQKFSQRSVAIERSVILSDLSPFALVPILESSGIDAFFDIEFQTNHKFFTNLSLVRHFYANFHDMSTETRVIKSYVNGHHITVTPDTIATAIGCIRPPVGLQASHPLVLSLEQNQLFHDVALVDLCGQTYPFPSHISSVGLDDRPHILHRILTGTVFCKSGSLSEVTAYQAFCTWKALKGEVLDIAMMIWSQMYDAYDKSKKTCLPFGSLIMALLPAEIVTEGLAWTYGLAPLDKRAITAMGIRLGPRVADKDDERLSRLEELVEGQGAQLSQVVDGVGALAARFEEMFTVVRGLTVQQAPPAEQRDETMED